VIEPPAVESSRSEFGERMYVLYLQGDDFRDRPAILSQGRNYWFSTQELGLRTCGDDPKLNLQLIDGFDNLMALAQSLLNVRVTGIALNPVQGASPADVAPGLLLQEFRRRKDGGR
jgi:hypothetical protein